MIKKVGAILVLLTMLAINKNSVYAEDVNFDYSEIFENHKLVKLIIDVETGALIKVNQAAADYYGYTSETLLKMKITEINTLSSAETERE